MMHLLRMGNLGLVLACLACVANGQLEQDTNVGVRNEDTENQVKVLATLLQSLDQPDAFNPSVLNPSVPMPVNIAASRSGQADISMRPSARKLKAIKWAMAKRPKKTTPSDINRKPPSWLATQPPRPDIPWITPTGKKVPVVKETELPKMGLQMPRQRMYMPRKQDTLLKDKKWYLVDAEGMRLGRMASEIAKILLGKYSTMYTPGVCTGDYVVVVNAEKVIVTGKKFDDKLYRRHSGRPGSMKIETFKQLQARIPERIVEKAIVGMLPKNSYGRELFRHLKVYKGPDHPHEANNVEPITFSGLTVTPDLRKMVIPAAESVF